MQRARGLARRLGNRFVAYCKMIANDYATVARETMEVAVQRKYRTMFISACLGTGYTAIQTNPSQADYLNQMTADRLSLMQISDLGRNQSSTASMLYRTDLLNQRRLSHVNLVFCSLMVWKDYNDECALYVTQCKQTQPRWRDWIQRIEDIGYFGVWHYAKQHMRDYDVLQE